MNMAQISQIPETYPPIIRALLIILSQIGGRLRSALQLRMPSSPFYEHGLTLIPTWLSNYIHYNVWDVITYPFLNFNGCTVEVYEWISNFLLHFTGLVIIILAGIKVKSC